MDDVISEIKSKIDIVDFINSYVPLKRVGRNYRALCPFHQEKTPSFIVSPERQIWRCFGACQEGGDVIKFYMKWENLTFFEAVKELAQKVGVEIKGRLSVSDVKWQEKSRIFAVNKAAGKFFSYVLFYTKFGEKARKYLEKRGVEKGIAEKFELGYAPLSENSLVNFLTKKGFSKSEIIKAGLAIGKGSKVVDRFKGRLMFPLKNYRGEILGFAGRVLDKGEPKYVNIPETLVYKKRQTLFGLDLAKEEIKKKGEVFIVEGEFDMITPFQLGIKNIVAIKGSAITKEQLMLLKRFCKKVVFLLDNDEAGREAVRRGFENAKGLDLELYVVVIDFAKDPDEAVKKDFKKFKKLLRSPQVIYDYFIEQSIKNRDLANPYVRKEFLEEIGEVLNNIENPVVKDFYIKKVAELAQVSEKVVKEVLRKVKRKGRRFEVESLKEKKIDPEKFLLGLILQSDRPKEYAEKILKILSPKDFSLPSLQQILEELLKFEGEFTIDSFSKNLSSPLQDVLNELYLYPTFAGIEKEQVEKLAYFVKIKALKRRIKELLENDEEEKLQVLTKELKKIEEIYLSL